MPWYQLKRAMRLGGPKGRDYAKGIHELPESLESDPDFLEFVQCGLIVEGEKPSKPVALDPAAQSKALMEKLQAKRKNEIAKAEAEEKAKEESKDSEEMSESKAESKPAEHKKKKKG